jgi:uncharacterized protein YegP (UPF0339 family)
MKVEIFKDDKREFRLRFTANNGNKLMVSEGYKRRAGALGAYRSVLNAFKKDKLTWK